MIRTKMRNKRFLLFFVSFLVLAVTVGVAWVAIGGGGPGGQDGDGDEDQVASGGPGAEWVIRISRVLTLERMLDENDPQEVIDNADPTAEERLQVAGILIGEGPDLRVQNDRHEWNFGEGPGVDDIHPRLVDSALTEVMRTNSIMWCDSGELPADTFVASYIRAYEGSYESPEQYEASIEDYVDCGTGKV